jgi:hypothetical protein
LCQTDFPPHRAQYLSERQTWIQGLLPLFGRNHVRAVLLRLQTIVIILVSGLLKVRLTTLSTRIERSEPSLLCFSLTEMPQDRTPLVCFLTDSETNNSLCLRYWSVNDIGKWSESYNELLADAGLTRQQMTNMLRSACRAYLLHCRCNTCGTAIEVGTRSEYSPLTGLLLGSGKRSQPPQCAPCETAALAASHYADHFVRQQHRDRVADALERMHDQSEPIDYTRLTYVQTCFLYAILVAASVGPGERIIPSLDSLTSELAATQELSEEIYKRLYVNRHDNCRHS